MIDLDIFGRQEIKRLNFELRDRENRLLEAKHELSYLRGVRTAQAASVEALQKRLKAEQDLNRQLQDTNRKLFGMYRASEEARQKLAGRPGETARRVAAPYGTEGTTCAETAV